MKDFKREDRCGNIVKCKKDIVTVFLKEKKVKRNIGFFDSNNNFVKPGLIEAKHKFKKNQGWGVNYEVVEQMLPGTKIIFQTDVGIFEITKEKIALCTQVLMFLKQGYELQKFIPQSEMECVG